MSEKNINFEDKKIKKVNFTETKKYSRQMIIKCQILIKYQFLLVSKKEPYDTKYARKYFIGYNDNDVIRPLC